MSTTVISKQLIYSETLKTGLDFKQLACIWFLDVRVQTIVCNQDKSVLWTPTCHLGAKQSSFQKFGLA